MKARCIHSAESFKTKARYSGSKIPESYRYMNPRANEAWCVCSAESFNQILNLIAICTRGQPQEAELLLSPTSQANLENHLL